MLRRTAKAWGFELIEQPGIEIEFLEFELPELSAFDWIFFNSPNAVKAVTKYFHFLSSKKIACVGSGTARAATEAGFTVQFVGSGSDTSDIGRKFRTQLGEDKVWIPVSNRTLGNVANELPTEQVSLTEVYRTEPIPQSAHFDADILILTSPSNVSAFASLLADSVLVAYGQATAKEIKERGFHAVQCTDFSEYSIVQALQKLT